MIVVLGVFCRISGKILPKQRSLMAQTGGTGGGRGPDLRPNPRRPLDQVVPGVPQNRPVGQRNHVPPAPVTAKPLGAPATSTTTNPHQPTDNSSTTTNRRSPTS